MFSLWKHRFLTFLRLEKEEHMFVKDVLSSLDLVAMTTRRYKI